MRCAGIALFAVLWLTTGSALASPVGLVWRVEGAENHVYLAGSMHMLPPRAYPLPPPYERAYEATERLVLEADQAALQRPQARDALLAAARYDAGDLRSHVGEELYRRTRAVARDQGLSMRRLDGYRPWFVAMAIEMQSYRAAGFRPDLGLDGHFHERALADARPVQPLQVIEAHLAIVTDMPASLSRDQLAITLDSADELAQAPADIYAYWRNGDAAGLAASVAEQADAYPALYDRLIYDRNEAWLPTIERLLARSGNALVLVGAVHLVGPRGLVERLRASGYRVIRVE